MPPSSPSSIDHQLRDNPDSQPPGHLHDRWLYAWNPEDPHFWQTEGRRVAWRNLSVSVYAEFLGFCVWALWSTLVPLLPAAGIDVTLSEQFWLISVPALVGATIRIPYSIAVTRFGGRNWTVVSSLLLIVPAVALVCSVSTRQPFPVLLICAGLAGFGGGNFASSMTNISFFFPEADQGRALGLNAAGGNLGIGVVQLAIPALIAIGVGIQPGNVGILLIPLVLIAALLAWRHMDNLHEARSHPTAYREAAGSPHTWLISLLYIGTFGSFVGYAGVLPVLLMTEFPAEPHGFAVLGAVIGALSRPVGGALGDRWGGAWVTISSFVLLAVGACGAVWALTNRSFDAFVISFVLMLAASGLGNGATYRMIPAVFRSLTLGREAANGRSRAAACIGIAGAIGAYGGFVVPQVFRFTQGHFGSLVPALQMFTLAYLGFALLTYFVYARSGSTLAAARV